jgi:hypothetical protein
MGLFLIMNNIEPFLIEKSAKISIEKIKYFDLSKKICGTLRISDGTPKCRGTQFENHCPNR